MKKLRTVTSLALATAVALHVGCDSVDTSSLTNTASPTGPADDGGSSGGPVITDVPPGDASASTDGATADAGVRDCTGLVVCDDFEANAVGSEPANWDVIISPAGAGTATVSTEHAKSGTKSVRLVTTIMDAVPYVQIQRGLTLSKNVMYGRMNVWATAIPNDPRHWNIIEGWGYVPGSITRTIPEQIMYELGAGGTDHALGAFYLNNTTDCFQPSKTTLPQGRWTCLEWRFDGIANEMSYWIDGTLVPELTVTHPTCGDTWYAPTFERISLGWYNAAAEPGRLMEMWIDDVAVDTSRVGCGANP